jgi:hypothetical protein
LPKVKNVVVWEKGWMYWDVRYGAKDILVRAIEGFKSNFPLIRNIVVSISTNFGNYSQTQDILFLELNYNNLQLIKMNMK